MISDLHFLSNNTESTSPTRGGFRFHAFTHFLGRRVLHAFKRARSAFGGYRRCAIVAVDITLDGALDRGEQDFLLELTLEMPICVMTVPLTDTRPSRIISSACRLLATPQSARYF